MTENIKRLEALIQEGFEYVVNSTEEAMVEKTDPNRWSKQEILGHLIDSAINNLKRFTEVQFEAKPYQFQGYKQNELVNANDYQNADVKELLRFWLNINKRIMQLMRLQTEETLAYTLITPSGEKKDLRYLMEDYVVHLAHHLSQIKA